MAGGERETDRLHAVVAITDDLELPRQTQPGLDQGPNLGRVVDHDDRRQLAAHVLTIASRRRLCLVGAPPRGPDPGQPACRCPTTCAS